MKIILQFLCLFLLHTPQAWSNNVQVSNVRLTGQDTTNDFTMVEFDISWENSWRYSGGPANWDAAWIFVKFKVGSNGEWTHARLNNSGHLICGSTALENGLLSPGDAFNAVDNPVLGIFLFRSIPGSGTFSCDNVQLRWNYGTNGVSDNEVVDVQVFAIEFVYVPQGGFQIGTADGVDSYSFYTYPNQLSSYLITAEHLPIQVGPSNDNLYYSASPPHGGDQSGPVPAEFPKGFTAFYAMKYEISQKAYADFLNTLTRVQQQNRVATDIAGMNITNVFVMSVNPYPEQRNGISCRLKLPPQPGPVDFFCDLNNNGIGNEVADGLAVACNYLSYGDVAAYLDWAALRLMTEFEFEKCARGPSYSVLNEFAWGNSVLITPPGLLNWNMENEIPLDLSSNMGHFDLGGPIRCGAFARTTSNRTTSGAGYYGCLDLSGNLWERGVTIGNPNGRLYTGIHGDGSLSMSGAADVENWPSTTNAGSFLRGGSYGNTPLNARVSDRRWVTSIWNSIERQEVFGGRGIRTAE